jgi:hypothetical protein
MALSLDLKKRYTYGDCTVYEWTGQVPVNIFNNHLMDLDDIFGKR